MRDAKNKKVKELKNRSSTVHQDMKATATSNTFAAAKQVAEEAANKHKATAMLRIPP